MIHTKTLNTLSLLECDLQDVPVLNCVPCGPPLTPTEGEAMQLESYITDHPTSTLYIKVCGDSMTEKGIPNGCVVAVDTKIDPAPGDVGVFCLDDNLYTCKSYEPPYLVGYGASGTERIELSSYTSVVMIGRVVTVIARRY